MATLSDDLALTQRVREHFEKLITNPELLGPDFQPIRRLEDDTVVGWRAVGRVVPGTDVADRAALRRYAIDLGLAERVDWAFRCRIFDVAAQTGLVEPIHIKVSFQTYSTPPPPRLIVAFGRSRSLQVVNELQEAAFDHPTRLATGLGEFASWGWSTALPDVTERTDTGTILQRVRPAMAIVDLSRPGRSTEDGLKRYVETAQRLGVEVMATGLDTPLRVNEAKVLGATYGRGNALGVAGPPAGT